MSTALSLTAPPELVKAIAEQVVAGLADWMPRAEGAGEEWRLWNLQETARRLGRCERWVRQRKAEIGYVKLDDGALAFDPDDVKAFTRARRVPLADDTTLEPRSRVRAVERGWLEG